jgi:hypothetical protein
MKIKKTASEIFSEYEKGQEFNSNIGLYDNVEKNEKFYLGDQWSGVNAKDLMKPVFNIMKRVVTYFVAMIVSDDVGVNISPMDDSGSNKTIADIIAKEVENVLERTKTNDKCRTNVKNCCVDGDTALFINFDPDIETGQQVKGDVETEIIDNTHIIFGNPYSQDVQKQPYILIIQRLFVDQVKDMAEELGVSKDQIESITADDEDNKTTSLDEEELCTVITKFWKEKKTVDDGFDEMTGMPVSHEEKTVHFIKSTKSVILKSDTDLNYRNYPIAYMTWERQKNNYHGVSPVTGLIPNQIFINKIYAMCMVYMTNMGFPKVFYDKTKLGALSNDVSKAISLPNMDMAGKMIDAVKAPDFSNQIIQLVDSTISYTKDFMGASDAALGNISNPNNTSAIVAVQQASSVPLEIQKLDYYEFYEEIVRSIVDIMANSYGVRTVKITQSQAKSLNLYQTTVDQMGNTTVLTDDYGNPVYKTSMDIDFSQLKDLNYQIDVEIGQSSYWSEATTVQTMDNLFDRKVITDPVTYLESIPDKYIPNKQKIIDEIKQQQQEQQMLQEQQMQMQNQTQEQTADPSVTRGMQDGVDNRAPDGDVNNTQLQDAYADSKQYYGG